MNGGHRGGAIPAVFAILLRDKDSRRPMFGKAERFQGDPNFKDCALFYEYFQGDDGSGSASHLTGWTALVAKLSQQSGE
jgi:hypothetical protein